MTQFRQDQYSRGRGFCTVNQSELALEIAAASISKSSGLKMEPCRTFRT